jgi:hypothetical protein
MCRISNPQERRVRSADDDNMMRDAHNNKIHDRLAPLQLHEEWDHHVREVVGGNTTDFLISKGWVKAGQFLHSLRHRIV